VLKGKGDVLAMMVGTLLIGLSGYLFLALIGRGRFDATTTAALSATYLLANVLGPGIFIAVEQETSRLVSDAIARGEAAASGARRLLGIDGGLMLLTLLVLGALAPVLLSRVLGGDVGLIVALAISVVGSAAVYFVRGTSGGQRRFRRYALTVLIDGATRIAGCVGLVVIGSTNPVAFGVVLCAGPAVAALVTARGSGAPAIGIVRTPPAISQLARDVCWLLIASALWMIMQNLAPVVVTAMIPEDPVTAAGFAGAVVLTRVPLLFMGTIQSLLLPGMTAAAAAGDAVGLRRTVSRGLTVIGGIGTLAIIGTALFGRWAVNILFGADRDTTQTWGLVWLTASAVIFMAVQLLQPALVALRRHRALVGAWVAGAVAFSASFALPVSALDCGLIAQIAGPLVTLFVQLGVLSGYLRRRRARAAGTGATTPEALAVEARQPTALGENPGL